MPLKAKPPTPNIKENASNALLGASVKNASTAEQKGTVTAVVHGPWIQVRRMCVDNCVLPEAGRVVGYGSMDNVPQAVRGLCYREVGSRC